MFNDVERLLSEVIYCVCSDWKRPMPDDRAFCSHRLLIWRHNRCRLDVPCSWSTWWYTAQCVHIHHFSLLLMWLGFSLLTYMAVSLSLSLSLSILMLRLMWLIFKIIHILRHFDCVCASCVCFELHSLWLDGSLQWTNLVHCLGSLWLNAVWSFCHFDHHRCDDDLYS